MTKTLLFILLVFTWKDSFPQVDKNKSPLNIYGDWKCVKHDYKGLEKFTLKQAERIRKSILHIEPHTYYFRNIDFIGRCTFSSWEIRPYSGNDYVERLELTYTQKQLKKIYQLNPVNNNGETTCYDECALYKRADILITNCGGYIFYWIKDKK